MATEEGIVTEILAGGRAIVKASRSAACESCSAKGSCNSTGDQQQRVEVLNPVGAALGDRILLRIESGTFLKVTFLLYIVPVLGLLAGALTGQQLAPTLDLDPSGFSALCGFACFVAAVLFVRRQGRRMADQNRYRPQIVRVIRRA